MIKNDQGNRLAASRFGVNGIQPCGVIQPYPFLLNLKEVMMKFQFVQHHEPECACVGYGNPKGEFDDRNNPELADHYVKIPESLYTITVMHDDYDRHSAWPIV